MSSQNGKTILHVASFNGYAATVSMFLKELENPNAKDDVRTAIGF